MTVVYHNTFVAVLRPALSIQPHFLPLRRPDRVEGNNVGGLLFGPLDVRLAIFPVPQGSGIGPLRVVLGYELLKGVGDPLGTRGEKAVVGPDKGLLPASPFSTTKRRLREVEAAQKVFRWECV